MKFGKFELNLALTGFVKFIVAARKFVSVKQASADFTVVRIKKERVWLPAYKFNIRVKFDLFRQNLARPFAASRVKFDPNLPYPFILDSFSFLRFASIWRISSSPLLTTFSSHSKFLASIFFGYLTFARICLKRFMRACFLLSETMIVHGQNGVFEASSIEYLAMVY